MLGDEPLRQKNIFLRFLQYIIPYNGSIVLAMMCAFVMTACELGRLQILADTIDALTQLEGFSRSPTLVPIRFLHIEGVFEGFEILLTDVGAVLRFFFGLLAGVLGLVFVKGFFVYGNDFLMERVGNKLSLRVRNDLYEKIVSAPLGTLSKHHSGDVMTRVTDDVRMWQRAVTSTAAIMRAVIQVISFVAVMLYKNLQMTIFATLVLPVLAFFIARIGTRVRKASTEIQKRSSDIYAQLKETLSGINIIKSFTAESAELERFQAVTSSQYRSAIRRARFASLLPPAIEWISAIGSATVFGFGCWQVIEGELSIGWFVSYFVMVAQMFKPIKTIGSVNNVLQQSLASAERIFQLLDFGTESGTETDGKRKLPNVQGAVQFRNVSFAYQEQLVIKNVNFTAAPGEIIALVGPSGSGKTTLLNLLLRFYTANTGTILIDSLPITEVTLTSLRQNIALVPQDTFLFDGTVLENIGYGSPKAPRRAIIEAAKKANAHRFITEMPHGYDTPIGEAGGNLSGGEQQRLSIARAILKDAPILILDEATSALDTQSEAIIQESLVNLMADRTSFIIAHRLSTVKRADKILVVNDGEILESGTHQQLLEKGGLYRKLCEQQLAG